MKRKTAKNGEGLVSFIMWVTSGGHEVDIRGRGPTAKKYTGSFIQVLYRSSGLKTLAWSKLLTFTGKKLTFGVYLLHIWISSTPRPLTWWMRPGRFVYYTECKPNNKKRGRPGNEANSLSFRRMRKNVMQHIFGHDFLSPCTTIFSGIENYLSASMSCCSDDMAQLLPCLDHWSLRSKNISVREFINFCF